MLGVCQDAHRPVEKPRRAVNGVTAKDPVMVLTSVNVLVDALREVNLLRKEQFDRLVNEIAPKFDETTELAKHLVKQGWLTLYQAKKLLSGHGKELVIGHYVILDKLGEGGMGKVYKAKQLRLNRFVALKVIRPNLIANEMALKRFQREAKAAAQLAHPNIVRLFDADQVGDRHFLAMEYIEGNDLSALVKESGPLPIGMACSFIRQAASGLQHAQDLGLVHRDIKPSNLLVTAPKKEGKTGAGGAGGVIKILDMGLARVGGPHDNDSAETALTQDGTVIGTPDYMSPEQAKNSSSVDARSDLYSLGCTFYYLLTGQTPFPVGTTLEKLLQHQMDAPKHIQLLRQDIPNEVAAIVHMLIAKRPEDRFQNGAALAQALEPWSVFDAGNSRLKSTDAPTLAVPSALPVEESTSHLAPTESEPFNFESVDKDLPQPTEPEPPSPAPTPKSKSKKPIWWTIVAIGGLVLLIGGILIANSFGKKSASPATKDELTGVPPGNSNPKTVQPPAKREMESIEAYLPSETEFVAVLNVPQLAKSRYFQENLLKEIAEPIKSFKDGSGFDPLTGIERVILCMPSGDWEHPVIVVQGPDGLPQKFVGWVTGLEGVKVKDELVRGVGLHRIYVLPDKEKDEPTYGAILQMNPFSVILSSNKDRVLDAVARAIRKTEVRFEDPSVRTMLLRYPGRSSAPALWIGMGTDTKLFGMIGRPKVDKIVSPRNGSLHATYATLRLGDHLDFDAFVEAETKPDAEFFWRRLNFFFKNLTENNKDTRLERIANLFSNARELPKMKVNSGSVHQWTLSISNEKLDDWFAPFFKEMPADPMEN